MNSTTPPAFAALIGLDWGDQSHALALQPEGQPIETSTLTHSAESVHHWLDQLELRFQSRLVAVAIETDQGALLHALLERPWIVIYPIHPATSTRHRKMFRPSGAADDLPDALVLLSLLQHYRDRLRPLLSINGEPAPLSQFFSVSIFTPSLAARAFWSMWRSIRRFRMGSPSVLGSPGAVWVVIQ